LKAAAGLLNRASLATPRVQPTATDIAMEKGWLFRKTKHDGEAGSSVAKNKQIQRDRRYVPMELAHQLFEENRPIP
jgi:hypothetical protein